MRQKRKVQDGACYEKETGEQKEDTVVEEQVDR